MTDHKLLALAAKAAGGLKYIENCEAWIEVYANGQLGGWWHPLTHDGDALRLAVKLGLLNDPRFLHERDVLMFTKNMPKLEATRRAIVSAAAEIGKTTP